jgi:hypothetical protein
MANETNKLLQSLKQTIKAFNGDVYGSILTIDNDEIEVATQPPIMHCRIDLYLCNVFVQILNLHYNVQSSHLHINELFGVNKQFIITYQNDTVTKVVLDVCFQTTHEWSKLHCDFDVHLLAENTSSLFLRTNYLCLDKFVDKIGFIQKRIQQKQFTLLDTTFYKTIDKLKMLIDKTHSMVQRGWVMDDTFYGDDLWNINRWITYQMRPQVCRVHHDKKKLDMLVCMNECPLCNEQFHDGDIVINTKCNHNFHWCNSRCKGLSEWLRRGHVSCPVCRKTAL